MAAVAETILACHSPGPKILKIPRRFETVESFFGEDKTEVLEIYEVKPSYLKNMILTLKMKGRILKIRIENKFRGLGAYLVSLSDLEKMRKTY